MTSVYDEKIYPQIPAPTAPPDDESYRLKKIDELEKFLRSEVESRDKLTKRFKRRATTTTFTDGSVNGTASTSVTVRVHAARGRAARAPEKCLLFFERERWVPITPHGLASSTVVAP